MVEPLSENITFNHNVVIGFHQLTDDIENTIYRKLSEQEFTTKEFEVLNIREFTVKEMLVSGITVVCDVLITAECNSPRIGKIIKVENFEIIKDNIIYTNGRIQIISKLPDPNNIKTEYYLEIQAIKLITKNILCVSTVKSLD